MIFFGKLIFGQLIFLTTHLFGQLNFDNLLLWLTHFIWPINVWQLIFWTTDFFLTIDFSPVDASFIVLLSFKGHILSFCPLQDCFLDHLSFSSLLDLLWKTNTPTFKEIFHQLTVYSASPDILKNLHLFPPPNFCFSDPLGQGFI